MALIGLAACGAPDSTTPVHTAVVKFNPASGKYELTKVDLQTITDLASLTGSVANIIGGASIVINESDPVLGQAVSANDTQKIHDLVLQDPGGPVRASFITEGTTQWPADFDSENMVTTYYNFERAFTFYDTLGWSQAYPGPPPVYYSASFVDTLVGKDALADNAAFFPVVSGFLILPFKAFQDIPLPMNLGIIGHEYSHFMVNTRVYGGEAIPHFYTDYGLGTPGPTPAMNVLKAFDEGFADLFGTGVTCLDDNGSIDPTHCDPNFISDSIPDVNGLRRLDGNACLGHTLNNAIQTDNIADFDGPQTCSQGCQYALGTILASSIWAAASTTGDFHGAFQAVYDSLDDPNALGLKQALDQLGDASKVRADSLIANLVIAHASSPPLKAALCSQFMARLGPAEVSGDFAQTGSVPGATGNATGTDYCHDQCGTTNGQLKPYAVAAPVMANGDPSTAAGCLCACQDVDWTPVNVCQ